MICICSIMLFHQFGKLGYWAYFKMHQKVISQQHCINQERPEMKCNGKCYMMKQVKKMEVPVEREPAVNFSFWGDNFWYFETITIDFVIPYMVAGFSCYGSHYEENKGFFQQEIPPPERG